MDKTEQAQSFFATSQKQTTDLVKNIELNDNPYLPAAFSIFCASVVINGLLNH